ncbi:uncharacterized protein At4g00950-like [Salvia hispanica]|uniref:uncharacterized protein At4g00950-like n=1 Tax=Salvia hispanica TaxID=49212 RepID=UPI0020098066|nr:uncharacterized protein At4g00950-like [Salvia hispanica]
MLYQVEPTYKLPAALSPEHPSGAATPPLHALASVPFKWEEQPGKPRPCTDIILRPEPAARRCLELPPCRITKMPSPTTVLDGPDNLGRPKFSSFRLFREKQISFDSSSGGSSPQSYVTVGKKSSGRRLKMSSLFGRSLRVRSGGKEADEGSLGFSPSSFAGFESHVEGKKIASFSRSSPTPLLATMYEGLKQAIPWKRTRKSKKEGSL